MSDSYDQEEEEDDDQEEEESYYNEVVEESDLSKALAHNKEKDVSPLLQNRR